MIKKPAVKPSVYVLKVIIKSEAAEKNACSFKGNRSLL